jgi:hypothetical protein
MALWEGRNTCIPRNEYKSDEVDFLKKHSNRFNSICECDKSYVLVLYIGT